MEGITRVLVVDDSAYVRKVITKMLERSPHIEVVGVARNGIEALEQAEKLKPDVVTLDLIMPEMDGLGFLREQMARHPLPVVVVSIASESGESALAALDLGAVDFIQKPTALALEKVYEISDELLAKVKSAASAKIIRLPRYMAGTTPVTTPITEISGEGLVDIVVMGISTGGPQALRYLMPLFPAAFPVPIAIVMHMPVGYTAMYAEKLNTLCELEVVEASEGTEAVAGRVLLAPAGRHMSFNRLTDGRVVAHLDLRPFDTLHRPSVDILFQAAAETYGGRTLGVVMTGMGSDGKQGAAAIKAQGGQVFTEAEESCVIYGMPRSVDEAGHSDRSLMLSEIAQAVIAIV